MVKFFNKSRLSALALLSLSFMSTSLTASNYNSNCCESPNRLYVGGFGGELFSNSTRMSQMGTAFFTEAQGGPLAVYAHGRTKKETSGFGGAQIGYEWGQCFSNIGCSGWSLASAAEIEAYFYSHKKKGHFINDTDRLEEHDFANSFNLDSSVILANAVFSLNSTCMGGFTPYFGGGIGATHIDLRHAKSLQVAPPEAGVNHFNSKRKDTSWAFAAQAKAGLRYNFCKRFHIFAEYRYLYVDSSNYILGSTVYSTHAPTSPWNVKLKNIHYNAFAIGVQYDL